VLMVTATDELDTAVRCMRAGAFDYLVKPISRERLHASIERVMEMRALRRENLRLKARVLSSALRRPDAFSVFDFDADRSKMLSVFRYVETIAGSPGPVLITGETGVGKEIMARCIHALSGRRGEMVSVNVAGLDMHTFSDTLFGHRKGAFTGAMENRSGLVERAAGGTLFLDEIGDLGLELQVKLLRLLQEREYFPLGSDVPRRSDARVIVATNRSIDELRTTDRFRRDLYFRLCQHHVRIPALRERLEDLPALAQRMLGEIAEQLGRAKVALSRGAMNLLCQYDFPGNVRELHAMLSELAAQEPESGMIAETSLADWMRKFRGVEMAVGGGSVNVARLAGGDGALFTGEIPTLKNVQKQLIEEALRRSNGNQAAAAKMLGITRQALNRRLVGQRDDAAF
jgi:DNA-binding NtrC family response regulator